MTAQTVIMWLSATALMFAAWVGLGVAIHKLDAGGKPAALFCVSAAFVALAVLNGVFA